MDNLLLFLGGFGVGCVVTSVFYNYIFKEYIKEIIQTGEFKPKNKEFVDSLEISTVELVNEDTVESIILPDLPSVKMYTEEDDGVIYGYKKENSQFMCKGRSMEEFVTHFLENYPDMIAYVENPIDPQEVMIISPVDQKG